MNNLLASFIKASNDSSNIQQWQRISAIALIYFLVKTIQKLVGNIVYIIPALIAGYSHIIDNPTLWLPIFIAVILFILVLVFLTFYFFQYRLAEQHIEIRSGILAKKHINLPFDRIQSVKLEQPFYYRPFNSVCLILDTAGSHKQEAKVVALDIAFAEQLKQQILSISQKKQNTATDTDTDTDTEDNSTTESNNEAQKNINVISNNREKILNTRSLNDLIIHGLSNNRVWLFLAGLAPFFDNIASYIGEWLTGLGINTEQLFSIVDKSWWQLSLYALTLTFMVLLPITLFSIFGAILSFYNFTLSKLDDRYIRRSGLFTKHEVTLKLSRLQMVIRQQDWLDLLLTRINLKFEQNQNPGDNLHAGAHNNKIIVPSVKANECQALIDDVYPDNNLATINFTAISKRYLKRNLLYILLPCYMILTAILVFTAQSSLLLWITPVFIFLATLTFMRWRRWGYAQDSNYIYIRKGAFGVDYLCFPTFKLQQSRFKQSIFLRKHQLCSVQLILASGAVTIPYIKQNAGYNLINKSLYQVEQSRRSWM
jgi:putative membrane protein